MAEFFHAEFKGFIDRVGVESALDKKEKKALSRAGGFARQVMRRGMRRRKKSSQPGNYPSARQGDLRKYIFFNYDQATGSVAIGPIRFDTQPDWLPAGFTVPQLVNQGGRVRRRAGIGRRSKIKTVVYRPRPFVDLSLPASAAKLAEIYDQTPLRK